MIEMERGTEAPMDICDRPAPKWGPPLVDSEHVNAFADKSRHRHVGKEFPRMFKQLTVGPRHLKKSCNKRSMLEAFWDPNMPHLLIGYVQLLFNLSLAIILLYIIGGFVHTVRTDIASKTSLHRAKLSHEIEMCSRSYHENKCSPKTRVPALEQKCREWESCMQRRPDDVGGGKVVAETVADIVNGLLEPITIKSLLFIAIALFGCVFVSNYAFALAKSRLSNTSNPTVHISTLPYSIDKKHG